MKPFRLYWYPRLRSTNDHAALMRKEGRLFAPAIVLTGRQTAGRGRGGNRWWSGSGTLTVTFAFPIEEHLSPHQLPLVAGLAARNAAAELVGEPAIGLKWPNDIVHDGRKLAGLLCERNHRVDLIGLGMNINIDPQEAPRSLGSRITSLYAIAGHELDITDALLTIARHMHQTLSRRNQHLFRALLNEYHEHHMLVGRSIRVVGAEEHGSVAGQCMGLDDMGRLLVQESKRLHRVTVGHVEMV